MSTIRIALLVCDTPMPSVIDIAGDYHSIFTTMLCDAAKYCGNPAFILDSYDVVDRMEYPPDDAQYDGIIISGSSPSSNILSSLPSIYAWMMCVRGFCMGER
jgi:hypothetical protein